MLIWLDDDGIDVGGVDGWVQMSGEHYSGYVGRVLVSSFDDGEFLGWSSLTLGLKQNTLWFIAAEAFFCLFPETFFTYQK